MSEELRGVCRFFVTYSGIKLPLKLSQPLEDAALSNRNTFFRGYFDEHERMTGFQKMVYGEVELEHRYVFGDDDALKRATIIDAEGEMTVLEFDAQGVQKLIA
jgi:hypothetical protein